MGMWHSRHDAMSSSTYKVHVGQFDNHLQAPASAQIRVITSLDLAWTDHAHIADTVILIQLYILTIDYL